MKFVYLLLFSLVITACGSESSKNIASTNPASIRAKGNADSLMAVLSKATDATSPTLNPAVSCPTEVTSLIGASTGECGAVKVPEDHRVTSNQRSVAVGYLKIPKVFDPKKPLLVIEQGGPGGSSISLTAMYLMMKKDLPNQFNILAVEQRGTPWTYPEVVCNDVVQYEIKLLEQTIDPVVAYQKIQEANEKCMARASKKMDIAKISTYQIAKDIVYTAKAMGYDQFNYYGVSYGTVVGQYLLKYSEANVKNVVLDSPAVVGKLWMNDAMENMDSLAQRKFESYIQKHLPHLSFDQAIAYFKAAAGNFKTNTLKVPVNFDGVNANVVVDDKFFMDLLFQMLVVYPEDSIVKMLLDAAQTVKSNPSQVNAIFGFLLPQLGLVGQGTTSIMYQSIICREFSFADLNSAEATKNWTFIPLLTGDDSVDEEMTDTDGEGGNGVCTLNIPKADEDVILSAPIVSDKTVLVVGGVNDHVTSPSYVAGVTVNMPHAHTSVFDDAAHGVFIGQECITKSITDYLLSPAGEYTNNCVAN